MTALYSYSIVETDNLLELRVRKNGDPDTYEMEVRTRMDEAGVLFRLCAVLFAHRCHIQYAGIGSQASEVHDEFVVRAEEELNEPRIRQMLADLRELLFGGLSVLEYLKRHHGLPVPRACGGEVSITIAGSLPTIEVMTQDQPGLLLTLAQAFYLMDISIAEAIITTEPSGAVRNTFRVLGTDARFVSPEFRRRLGEELTGIL